MSRLLSIWETLTAPHATDQDEARQEYMVKVILVLTGTTTLAFTIPIIVGWFTGAFDLVPVGIMLAINLAVGISYWLANKTRWREAILIPIALFFLLGLYGNYSNGLATTLNFFYVLMLLLSAMFFGWRVRLISLCLCIVSPLLVEMIHGLTSMQDLAYGCLPFAGLLTGIALLQWFSTDQLKQTLVQARTFAAELTEYRHHLEELVEERHRALRAANENLEREIGERRRAEEALKRAYGEMELRVQQRTAELTEANELLKAEVAERRRAEGALRESETRYRQLVDHAPAGIYEIDLANARLISVNDIMCEYTGYTREEFLAMNPFDLLTVKSQELFAERYSKILASEQVLENFEFQIRGKEGREFWGLLSSRLVHGQDGSVTATVVVHNITERKLTEEALAHERDLLHTLLDSSPDAIYFKDSQSRFTRINQVQAKALGVDNPADAIGKTDFDFFTPEHAQDAYKDERRIVQTGQPLIDKIEKIRMANKGFRWVSVTKAPIFDHNQQVVGIVGISRDIDERVRAEEALRRSEDLLHSVLESLPQNVYTKDLDGRFIFANQRYCEAEGKTLEEIIGKTDFDLHPRELAEKYRADDLRVIEGGQVFATEEEHEPLDGDSTFVQVIKTPLYGSEGNAAGTLGVFWDITERKRAEGSLRQSVAELQNLQHIASALLTLDELTQVMNTIAKGIVTHLGFDMVLVSRYSKEDQAFSGLALHPIPGEKNFDRILKLMGRMELKDDPTRYELPYQNGDNPLIDRVLAGGVVIGDSLAGFFQPWVPKSAAAAAQRIFGMKSFIDIPMQVKGQTIGTILAGVRDAPIGEAQQTALARVARQAAVAIENARLHESERQRSEELMRSNAFITALSQVAARIEVTLAPDQILEALGAELNKLGITYLLALLNPDTKELAGHYVSIGPDLLALAKKAAGFAFHDFRMPRDVWPVSQVLQSGKAVFVPDLIETSISMMPVRIPRTTFEHITKLVGITPDMKAICLPLKSEEDMLGIMTVWSLDLREEDVPAFSVFASQVAVAFENAQLMRDLEQSLEELKKTQSQLIQAQKMEAIGRLVGGVAHDFNNLLTVIQVNIQVLTQQLHPQDPLVERIQQIQEASERAERLVKQLLSFSPRESVEPQIVDLGQVVNSLDRMLQRMIGPDIELGLSLADGLWPVKADMTQIERVIINLVANARDAMPQGGRLFIETANVILDEFAVTQHVDAKMGDYVMLSVSDTGIGMDQHIKARVFEPFFTTKERGQGTGLGLSTVYGIVKRNGGHVWVYSEVGQGTTFKIHLPRAKAAAAVTPATVVTKKVPARVRQPEMDRGSETILVVEDEVAVRRLAVQILRAYGYKVLEAGDGVEALEVSQRFEGPIHLLLTDVVMPRMNGRELAQQLQTLRGETRVLYMSGYSDDVMEDHGLFDRGEGFLSKPFHLETLTQKIRMILNL